MVLGNLFLMNLFLAILLKNFEDQKNDKGDIEEEGEAGPGLEKTIGLIFTSMRVKLKRVIFREERKKVGAITKVQKLESQSVEEE